MGEIFKNCYDCGKTCINGQFCYDGGSISSSEVSLPRTLKIKIIANPDFWGFSGGYDDNILVSGYAFFSNGRYDFFDGFDEDHYGVKQCGATLVGSFRNEQRPDVGYRSVYDDETGRSHYNGLSSNDVMRGGAEVYLLDRAATKSTDQSSCDETDPQDVFKKSPDNFGFGNKILFNDEIYKNITGAWRLNTCNNCYPTGITNTLRFNTCSGDPKQHINFDEHFSQKYDPARNRCLSEHYLSEQECQPDGTTPKEYQGQLVSVVRNTGISPFITATFSYFGGSASGLRNGQQVLIYDSGNQFYNAYHLFDVVHSSNTTAKLLGTYGTETINYTGASGDKWIALGTIDPESCCGGAAYGINNTTKKRSSQPTYHTDIGRIFNNSKNKIYSNRGKYQNGNVRVDRSVIAASGSGDLAVPYLIDDKHVNVSEIPYFGPYYEIDNQDLGLRFFNEDNTIIHKNNTCYTKSQTLEIFSDCLSQSYEYESCEQTTKHYQNNVPRLAFVYRPCNFNDPCSFNESGLPYTAGASGMPSTLDDLKSGFGGQEIVMYINLGDAWGKEIGRRPCSCDGTPPGTNPPDVITISSPITYPCFPKFDLRPSGYGCQDPNWYVYAKNYLGIAETGTCDIAAFYNACWIKQPYTTYGYIRNLCGDISHGRKEVILSLAERLHTGDYNDRNPNNSVVEPLYKTFVTPPDQLGSGYPVNGSTGIMPYWGLADGEGRLAYPYFPTKIGSRNNYCGGGSFNYIDFDNITAFSGGFPKEGVPFLIEIDHEDYCVGCATSQLELKDHTITIESLPTKFYHGGATITGSNTYDDLTYKYGFNHCKYPGIAITPTYDKDSDSWKLSTCDQSTFTTQNEALIAASTPYVDETCGCIGLGVSTTLHVNPLVGTNIPKYWSSSGVENSYVRFHNGIGSGCDYGFTSALIADEDIETVLKDYQIYFAARMSCGSTDYSSADARFISDGASNGLSTWLACGGCSHSYPATDSKPNLAIDFYYVRTKYKTLFERMSDLQLNKNQSFLNNGASKGSFYGGNRGQKVECPDCFGVSESGISFSDGAGGTTCWETTNSDCIQYGVSSPYCRTPVIDEEAFTYNGGDAGDCSYFLTHPDYAGLNYIKWNNNIPGCHGAKIRLYGISLLKDNSSKHSMWMDSVYGLTSAIGSIGSGCSNDCFKNFNITDTSIYGPAEMFAANSGVAFYTWLGSSLRNGCSQNCSDFIDEVACLGDYCVAIENAIGCRYEDDGCCTPNFYQVDTGETIGRPGEKFPHQCWADNLDYTLLGEFTYFEFSSGEIATYGNGCVDGWYGYLNINHVHVCTDPTWNGVSQVGWNNNANTPTTSCLLAWEGIGLPNIGDTEILPFDEPIAYNYTQVSEAFGTSTSIDYKGICEYDMSVNKTISVDSEFIIPTRMSDWGTDVHLGPVNCNVVAGPTGNKIEVGSTCVKPIPFNTFNNGSQINGYGEIETANSYKVDVIKGSCFPEIMTVHKIECADGVYALHVSREYYEHDRNLYYVDAYIDTNTSLIVANREKLYGRIDGGQTITKYSCGTVPNNYKTASICDSGAGCSVDGSMDYFGLLPKLTETDGITPCFPETCVTGINPFSSSLCANYEVNGTTGSTVGRGGSGYFEVLPAFSGSPTGCLTFKILNPGSGYSSSLYNSGTDSIVVTGCAIPYFDRPSCISLSLKIYPNTSYDKAFDVATQSLVSNTGNFNSQYFVYSGSISYTNCGGYSCGFTTGIYPVTFGPCVQDEQTISCELSTETCDSGTQYYPNLFNGGSGTYLWKYYNLFYDSGDLAGLALDDADPDSNVWFEDAKPGDVPEPFPFNIQYNASPKHGRTTYQDKNPNQIPLAEIIPFAETGLKCLHSCIQDHTTCGGSFFCNKEFFPRRAYESGTLVAKFAPFSMCVQNGSKSFGTWLRGHMSDDFINTYQESTLGENEQKGWLDPCSSGSTVELLNSIGIDDHIIYVNDITPLLGARHPYFKMLNPEGLDSKSCVIPRSGCFDFLGTHNQSTINGIATKTFETGDTDTYSEIKQSGCLFEPFKIFMDIQCCPERLGHPGTEDPMYMSWIAQGIPAGACKGIVQDITCACYGTNNSCTNNAATLGITPYELTLIPYWVGYEISNTGCISCPDNNVVYFQEPAFDPCCGYNSGVAIGTYYDGNYYVFTTTDVGYTYGLLDRYSGSNDNYLLCTTTFPKARIAWDFCGNTSNARLIGPSLSTQFTLNGSFKVDTGSGIKDFGASGCYGNCNSYCSQLMLEFGCKCISTSRECDYPSLLKLTVTE